MRIATLLLLALFIAGCTKKEPTTPSGKQSVSPNQVSQSGLIKITSMNQYNQVISSEKLSLVDIYATWCGPCKMLAPILEELASEYNGTIQVVKVDGEKNRDIARMYELNAYPTMVLVKEGTTISKIVGFRQKQELKKLIDANM